MVQLSKQEAIRLKSEILSKITASRIPGKVTGELFNIYKMYVNPTKYREAPCTCSPAEWRDILQSVVSLIDRTISEPDVSVDAPDLHQTDVSPNEDVTMTAQVKTDGELLDQTVEKPKPKYTRKPKHQ